MSAGCAATILLSAVFFVYHVGLLRITQSGGNGMVHRARAVFCFISVYLLLAMILVAAAWADVLSSGDLSRLRSVGSVALSPDGRFIAYSVVTREQPGRPSGQLWVMDVASGKNVRLGGDKPAGGPVWSADSKWIAFSGADGDKHGLVIAHPDGSETTFLAATSGTNSPLPGTGKSVACRRMGSRSLSSLQRRVRVRPRRAGTRWSSPVICTSQTRVRA